MYINDLNKIPFETLAIQKNKYLTRSHSKNKRVKIIQDERV